MKPFLIAFACLWVVPTFSQENRPVLGNFDGLAFSSATSRHPIKIQGGRFENCGPVGKSVTKCDVHNGTLEVGGLAENSLFVTFKQVSMLHSEGKLPCWNYYLKGTSELAIGPKVVTVPVSVVLNVEDYHSERAYGTLDLPEQFTKTSIDAYRSGR